MARTKRRSTHTGLDIPRGGSSMRVGNSACPSTHVQGGNAVRGRYLLGMLALLIAIVFLLSGRPVSQAHYQSPALEPVTAWPEENLAAGPDLAPPPGWVIERPDAPHLYRAMGPRSLALDAAGHPHIAYGANFLYYAWHDGTTWH